jgi:hypothetical protein
VNRGLAFIKPVEKGALVADDQTLWHAVGEGRIHHHIEPFAIVSGV